SSPAAPQSARSSRGLSGILFEDELANLADARARQLVDDLDLYGTLRLREAFLAPGVELGDVDRVLPRLLHDVADRDLVADRVGPADHGGLEHRRMRRQHPLDLNDRHVLPRNLQHVAATSVEIEITILVAPREVACAEPPFSERLLCRGWIVEVSVEERDARHAAH